MEKRILVAVSGGKAKTFRTKRGFIRWAVTTRDGWKHLGILLLGLPIFIRLLIARYSLKEEIRAMREDARKQP